MPPTAKKARDIPVSTVSEAAKVVKRLSRPARLDRGRCRLVLLRPGLRKEKKSARTAKRATKAQQQRSEPLVGQRWWPELPNWIALHADRGPRHKCWEGHCLKPDRHDGRRYSYCSLCWWTPQPGSAILGCRTCKWSLCPECTGGQRLPTLRDDPLFQGPSAPCLFQAPREPGARRRPRGRGVAIICPGGNYEFLCANEGIPVANWFEEQGIAAYVLRYRLLPRHSFKEALADLERAVDLLRRRHRGAPIAAVGFSAGGHLVASHGISAKAKGTQPLDAQVLVYPAIDGADWVSDHKHGFWDWEACTPRAEELLEGRTALLGGRGFGAPPTFLVSSTADSVCSAREHGDPYAAALKRRRVPHEYVRGDFGDHGFGLEDCWAGRCAAWLQKRGFGVGAA